MYFLLAVYGFVAFVVFVSLRLDGDDTWDALYPALFWPVVFLC